MASRNLEDLHPRLKPLAALFILKCTEAGIKVLVTCTARTVKEQIALFAQGRQSLAETNALRKIAKMPPITAAENKKKVTWTLKSRHLIDLDDNITTNDKAEAFDVVILKDGIAQWDPIKTNVNKNELPDYEEIAKIGEKIGLKAGARFKNPDYPHFELPPEPILVTESKIDFTHPVSEGYSA